MLNRSAVIIGHLPAFHGWLKASGITDAAMESRNRSAERTIYLIPACEHADEIDEVVEDLFEEIFIRELRGWQPDESLWPNDLDVDLFARWFTVEGVSLVDDLGRGAVAGKS